MREHVDAPRLPADLHGKRALDVGTFDGFWAFALERRGASVVAIDVDEIPPPDAPDKHRDQIAAELEGVTPGTGFGLLRRWFGSSAQRRSLNVYDLTAEAIGGPIDLAFVGAMLLHLRNPVRALERIRQAMSPGGQLVVWEPIDVKLSKQKEPVARYMAGSTIWTWWYPNEACLLDWIRTAGFSDVTTHGRTRIRDEGGAEQTLVAVHARP